MKADSNQLEQAADAPAESKASAKPKTAKKKSSASSKTKTTASSSRKKTSSSSKAKQTAAKTTAKKQTKAAPAKQKADSNGQASEKKPSTRRKSTANQTKTKTPSATTKKALPKQSTARRSAKKSVSSEPAQPEKAVIDHTEPVEATVIAELKHDTTANSDHSLAENVEHLAVEAVVKQVDPEPLANRQTTDTESRSNDESINDTRNRSVEPVTEPSEPESSQPQQSSDDQAVEAGEIPAVKTDDKLLQDEQPSDADHHIADKADELTPAKQPVDLKPETDDKQPIEPITESISPSDQAADKPKWYAPLLQTFKQINCFFQQHLIARLAVKCLAVLLSLCLFLTGVASATYLVFLEYTYRRIEDAEDLDINRPKMWYVSRKNDYTMLSYHIGYGIYDKDFSYLMDKQNGRSGSSNIAENKADVINNLNGIINAAKQSSYDFYLFQGVDTASTRSYLINQQDILNEAFRSYSKVFATNYHTKYIFYPFGKNIGTITGGLETFSRYRIGMAVRRSLPNEVSGLSKHSAMDVCASISYLPVRNTQHYLVVINLDLPSYSKPNLDDQWELLRSIMEQEYADGNYVIAGGNWSRDMSGAESSSDQNTPDWLTALSEEQMPEHFSLIKPDNGAEVASHRSGEQPYQAGTSTESIRDGFIVSDNITARVTILDTGYIYSDHNPVSMTFRLK